MNPNTHPSDLKVTVLAGGVGGAKLVLGFDRLLLPGNLSVIVNTGDDFRHFGLQICPDLDSVTYAVAGLANKTYGWGQENETWNVADALETLGAPTWFQLGDRDLATHLERTRLLESGKSLDQVVQILTERLGIGCKIFPMTNDPAPTLIETRQGSLLSFQDYFVRLGAEPEVKNILLTAAGKAELVEAARNSLEEADLVVIAPSNPWVSVDPILTLRGVRKILEQKFVCAVSPIIQGKALKGPAAKMFAELGIIPSSEAVLRHYADILNLFVYDVLDDKIAKSAVPQGVEAIQLQTIMKSDDDKVLLAEEIVRHYLRSGGKQ
jgi:LPPG:FO 2-phospho-L-lactate transferase